MALSAHGYPVWIIRIATVGDMQQFSPTRPIQVRKPFLFCLHIPAGAAGVYPWASRRNRSSSREEVFANYLTASSTAICRQAYHRLSAV